MSSPNGGGVLPVVVIGAGPVGLVAAAQLVGRGEAPIVLEAGGGVGASIRGWSHVRLFSPWRYLTEPVSSRLLEERGWTAPAADRLPTGGELVERFLEPLGAVPEIAAGLRLNTRVEAVTRARTASSRSPSPPFEVLVRTERGASERLLARAVIDASGTYRTPNPLGGRGAPAAGEAQLRERIHYGIPDVRSRDRVRYAGKRTLVVGSGHSAFHALLDLASLRGAAQGTEIVWAVRRRHLGRVFAGGADDALPARGQLGMRLARLLAEGGVDLVTGFSAERVTGRDGRLEVHGRDAVIGPFDEIVVATGYRPELKMLRGLRLALDARLEAPLGLVPLIDPEVHSCGTVRPHGAAELQHPEPDFYIVGAKSYGRAPTFLLLTGYEQVRSVVCALTGDLEGARACELTLPETGVCGGGGCCVAEGEMPSADLATVGGARLPVLASACC